MKPFVGKDFLLNSPYARQLFETYAADMPIFDFHNHLKPQEIYEDRTWETITDLWLGGDHYKWRVMRLAGVPEVLITGDGDPYEKFLAFAQTLERLPGNALYHWVHLELQRYFGIDTPLCGETAREIYDACNELLRSEGYSARALLNRVNVTALCTTDDPFDSLEYHLKLAQEDTGFRTLPAYRPDKLLAIDAATFLPSIALMEARYGKITDMDSLKAAIRASIAHFKEAGCILTDHGLTRLEYVRNSDELAEKTLLDALKGSPITHEGALAYQSALLRFLGAEYTAAGIGMQLHLGALRNNNSAMFACIGPDTGYDSIGEAISAPAISALLDDLSRAGTLPNTVLYCLNPVDNPMLATMAVNFAPKVQFGSAWWFNDTLRGINRQLDELLDQGMLGSFVGMLTDSRSFSSFTRHEYFRRILCDKLANLVLQGEYPAHTETLGKLIQDVCYNNAVKFFNL